MPDTQTPTPEQPILSWTAPIRHTHERSPRWYMIGGIVVLIIAAYGVLSGAWSVALVTVLIGAMYFILRDHTFPASTITFTQSGVRLDETFLPWENAQGYWFLYTQEYTELHIVPKEPRAKEMVIQTAGTDMPTIKQTIGQWIPELTDKRERLLDAFIRLSKI